MGPAPDVSQVASKKRETPRCPYCHDDVGNRDTWRCPECGAAYHLPCAGELGRCGVLGCTGAPPRAASEEPPRCPCCHEELGERGQWRCTECDAGHHVACVRQLGHCAIAGCTGAPRPWQEGHGRQTDASRRTDLGRAFSLPVGIGGALVAHWGMNGIAAARGDAATMSWGFVILLGTCLVFVAVFLLSGVENLARRPEDRDP